MPPYLHIISLQACLAILCAATFVNLEVNCNLHSLNNFINLQTSITKVLSAAKQSMPLLTPSTTCRQSFSILTSRSWYLDQLGMSSAHDTKTYCRQTLIGGNYGLLNTTTFEPNPDYYSALLWHRLMGRNVLPTSFSGTKKIRAYAHCSRVSKGITLLLINLDKSTTVYANVAFNSTGILKHEHESRKRRTILLPPPYKGRNIREEFHLTAKDGDLHSQTVLLNGNILAVNSAGDIPPFLPVYVNSSAPIEVAPYSIVFAHLPNADVPACRWRH